MRGPFDLSLYVEAGYGIVAGVSAGIPDPRRNLAEVELGLATYQTANRIACMNRDLYQSGFDPIGPDADAQIPSPGGLLYIPEPTVHLDVVGPFAVRIDPTPGPVALVTFEFRTAGGLVPGSTEFFGAIGRASRLVGLRGFLYVARPAGVIPGTRPGEALPDLGGPKGLERILN